MIYRLLMSMWVLTFFLSSCGEQPMYTEKHTIEHGSWTYEDSLLFSFSIADTSLLYDLHLNILHDPAYLHQNVYLVIDTRFSDGRSESRALSIDMADKAGQWLGQCSSRSCTLPVTLQEHAYFDHPGEYQLTITQHNRDNPLSGISALELSIHRRGARSNLKK